MNKYHSVICILILFSFEIFAEKVFYYPSPAQDVIERGSYPLTLLQEAFKRSGTQAKLRPSKVYLSQERAMRTMEGRKSSGIDVMYTMTSEKREKILRPIRIPIYKGLIGLRIGLVKSNKKYSIKNKSDLDAYMFGQGHDWPDTEILKGNGLKVQTAQRYPALFQMLAAGRYDFFPRSVVEIWPEYEKYKEIGISMDETFALYYPTATYYFVRNDNDELANLLQAGLEKMIADGSFDKLFVEYHQNFLDRAKLKKRKIIKLKNPILPKKTPIEDKKLWIDL